MFFVALSRETRANAVCFGIGLSVCGERGVSNVRVALL